MLAAKNGYVSGRKDMLAVEWIMYPDYIIRIRNPLNVDIVEMTANISIRSLIYLLRITDPYYGSVLGTRITDQDHNNWGHTKLQIRIRNPDNVIRICNTDL